MKTISTLYFFLISYLISAQTTYHHCGEVFGAKKGKFVGPRTNVVEGDRIKSVEKGYQHEDKAKEFIYMNEVGMPISEALHLATYVNADLLDEADQLGQLKSGYFADIVATDENPEDEISTLTNVSFVMKNGTIYKN